MVIVGKGAEPPDEQPYRLSLYLLDYDRHGREMEAALAAAMETLDTQNVSREESATGAWLAWAVTGAVTVEVRRKTGMNAVASGLFIDPAGGW